MAVHNFDNILHQDEEEIPLVKWDRRSPAQVNGVESFASTVGERELRARPAQATQSEPR